jgi:signal transduction histidine kinase
MLHAAGSTTEERLTLLKRIRHDAKTPNSAVQATLPLLDDGSDGMSPYVKIMETASAKTAVMINMLVDLLDLESQTEETATLTSDPSEFSVIALVDEVRSLTASDAAFKRIKVDFSCYTDTMYGDRLHLQQLLSVLCLHCIEQLPNRSTLTVKFSQTTSPTDALTCLMRIDMTMSAPLAHLPELDRSTGNFMFVVCGKYIKQCQGTFTAEPQRLIVDDLHLAGAPAG